MSNRGLAFGLTVKAKPEADGPPTRNKRPTIFDDDLDAGSDDEEELTKGGNVFGEEEELTEFDASAAKKPSRPSAPAPKRKPTNKLPPSKPPVRQPKPLVDLDDDDEGANPEFGDLSSMRDTRAVAAKAESLDATIYDYDAFHNAHSLVHQQKKAAERQDAVERKPKYIASLLDAASRRKQDQQVAREKLLQKERENEGDEFADKEKFVTGAYKAQQEETRKLEEEENRKKEEDEARRRKTGGGMQGFYRSLMGEEDKRHQEAMEAAAKLERGEVPVGGVDDTADKAKTDVDMAAEMKKKGVNVHINDEGQVTDKRQLLSAGLNVAPAGTKGAHASADHLKSSNQKNRENAFAAGRYDKHDQKAMRERQTRMLETQLEESNKRKREEEEEERKKLEEKSKSRKTDGDIMSAKERYLARKKQQEEAKKKGAAA